MYIVNLLRNTANILFNENIWLLDQFFNLRICATFAVSLSLDTLN